MTPEELRDQLGDLVMLAWGDETPGTALEQARILADRIDARACDGHCGFEPQHPIHGAAQEKGEAGS